MVGGVVIAIRLVSVLDIVMAVLVDVVIVAIIAVIVLIRVLILVLILVVILIVVKSPFDLRLSLRSQYKSGNKNKPKMYHVYFFPTTRVATATMTTAITTGGRPMTIDPTCAFKHSYECIV